MHLPTRRGFANITTQVEEEVQKSGIHEGLCLVNAMHITASVFINDDEQGLLRDFKHWLDTLAPPEMGMKQAREAVGLAGPAAGAQPLREGWARGRDTAGGPSTPHYHHNRTGEDNADAHLKRQIMGREVVVAITGGKLDFGPWEQIFYGEFDGMRAKRVLIKIIGE
jgi:thiamine phosphate synthase YjbQ (UPF0047 family)